MPTLTLLVTPPLVQSNTPYPATPYLLSHLKRKRFEVHQADASLELILRLFCSSGLQRIQSYMNLPDSSTAGRYFLQRIGKYAETVDAVVRFLQNKDPALASQIVTRQFLPEGPRFSILDTMQKFGVLAGSRSKSTVEFARYLASLYIDDLNDVIRENIDTRFSLSRYAESLAISQHSFTPFVNALQKTSTLLDTMIDEITATLLEKYSPDFIGITVPFPGNLYAALRMGAYCKKQAPHVRIALGGGYITTELRFLTESAIFDYADFICLDDGALPLQAIIEHLDGIRTIDRLVRCFIRQGNIVEYINTTDTVDPPHSESGPPCYDGLPLDSYFSMTETLNPMHNLWSNGRWNKLALAHGCYWHSCMFCDTTLDYIKRYDPAPAATIVDWIQSVAAQTGHDGFHFVDEAAPPELLRAMAEELVSRQIRIKWWGNIRFDKDFTPSLASLLARSGCIALSGGLEAAQKRLLKMVCKGYTIHQAARVMHAISSAGIMVHAYLMYGLPTQTVQETIDSLECVRQLFATDCIHSGYWHRFSATVHSRISRNPRRFGIRIITHPKSCFACNDLTFEDTTNTNHTILGTGLNKALYNYMHRVGINEDVRVWFECKVPRPQLPRQFIASALEGH